MDDSHVTEKKKMQETGASQPAVPASRPLSPATGTETRADDPPEFGPETALCW